MTRKPIEERAQSLLKEFLLMFFSHYHKFYNIKKWFKIAGSFTHKKNPKKINVVTYMWPTLFSSIAF